MENKITMLTIKEAAAMVEGLTEYRVRQMCVNKQIPCIMAGKKYLISRLTSIPPTDRGIFTFTTNYLKNRFRTRNILMWSRMKKPPEQAVSRGIIVV